jgi:hypothetical protein
MRSFNLVFCNRNDGYARNQDRRIELFIEYYAELQKVVPEIHLSIIDWNPPEGKALLKDAFNWYLLQNVTHHIVTPEEHKRRFPNSKRQINDYTGRNIGLQKTNCHFSIILNQDIFIKREVFEEIRSFPDYGHFFFRAHREDVSEDSLQAKDMIFELPLLKVHDRLFKFPFNKVVIDGMIPFYETFRQNHIVQRFSFKNVFFRFFTKTLISILNKFLNKTDQLTILDFLFLHMNACGDFIVIPTSVVSDEVKYPETDEFYMHTDGYIMVQMSKRGLKQVIINIPKGVRHIDHSRPDRSTDVPYSFHEKKFLEILNEDRSN